MIAPSSLGIDVRLYTSFEYQHFERGLAAARLLLALGLLALQYLMPVDSQVPGWPSEQLFVVCFALYSVAMLATSWATDNSTGRWRLFLNGLDVLWPSLLWLSSGVSTDSFLLLVVIALLAVAFRSGFRAVMAVTGVVAALLPLQAALLPLPTVPPPGGLESALAQSDSAWRAPYLLLLALTVGSFVGRERRFLAEATVLSRLAAEVHREEKPEQAVNIVGVEILRISRAERVVFIGEDTPTGRALLWDVREGGVAQEGPRPVDGDERDTYLFPMAADCVHVTRLPWPRDRVDGMALDLHGARMPELLYDPAELLQHWPAVESLAFFSLGQRGAWRGRLLLVNPLLEGSRLRNMRFLQRLVHFVAPVVQDRYALHRLRSRAKARERLRLADELHDGVIQSLMAAEMEVAAAQRTRTRQRHTGSAALARARQVLHEETLNLRDLMQRLKPSDVDPGHLLDALDDVIDRFQRDTGIAVRLHADIEPARLAPRTCAAISRIVQEALSNVRKHSKARSTTISLVPNADTVQMLIEDDGRGFVSPAIHSPRARGATGRNSTPPGWRPRLTVIEECVRAIDGKLSVESGPGQGVRFRIAIPTIAHRPGNRQDHHDSQRLDVGYAVARSAGAVVNVTTGWLHTLRGWKPPVRLSWHNRAPGRIK